MKTLAETYIKLCKLLLHSTIGMVAIVSPVMAWQLEVQIPNTPQTKEGETSFITIDEIIKKQRGYIIHEGADFHLLPSNITNNSKLDLGSVCEMLFYSNTPFQSYFYRESIPNDEKCITVNNVACADGTKITTYKKIVFIFDKITGNLKRVNTLSPVSIQNDKYLYKSKSNMYLPDYFCDMRRITEPNLHWIDFRSNIKYNVHFRADSSCN